MGPPRGLGIPARPGGDSGSLSPLGPPQAGEIDVSFSDSSLGLKITPQGKKSEPGAIVKTVTKKSPAAGKVKPGMALVGVAGNNVKSMTAQKLTALPRNPSVLSLSDF